MLRITAALAAVLLLGAVGCKSKTADTEPVAEPAAVEQPAADAATEEAE